MFPAPMAKLGASAVWTALLCSLALPAPVRGISVCHDYTAYRVRLKALGDEANYEGLSREVLIIKLEQLRYRKELELPVDRRNELEQQLQPGDVIIFVGIDHSGFVEGAVENEKKTVRIDHFLQEWATTSEPGTRRKYEPKKLPTDDEIRVKVWKRIKDADEVHGAILHLRDKYENVAEMPKDFWVGGLSEGDTLRQMIARRSGPKPLTGIEVWRKPAAGPFEVVELGPSSSLHSEGGARLLPDYRDRYLLQFDSNTIHGGDSPATWVRLHSTDAAAFLPDAGAKQRNPTARLYFENAPQPAGPWSGSPTHYPATTWAVPDRPNELMAWGWEHLPRPWTKEQPPYIRVVGCPNQPAAGKLPSAAPGALIGSAIQVRFGLIGSGGAWAGLEHTELLQNSDARLTSSIRVALVGINAGALLSARPYQVQLQKRKYTFWSGSWGFAQLDLPALPPGGQDQLHVETSFAGETYRRVFLLRNIAAPGLNYQEACVDSEIYNKKVEALLREDLSSFQLDPKVIGELNTQKAQFNGRTSAAREKFSKQPSDQTLLREAVEAHRGYMDAALKMELSSEASRRAALQRKGESPSELALKSFHHLVFRTYIAAIRAAITAAQWELAGTLLEGWRKHRDGIPESLRQWAERNSAQSDYLELAMRWAHAVGDPAVYHDAVSRDSARVNKPGSRYGIEVHEQLAWLVMRSSGDRELAGAYWMAAEQLRQKQAAPNSRGVEEPAAVAKRRPVWFPASPAAPRTFDQPLPPPAQTNSGAHSAKP